VSTLLVSAGDVSGDLHAADFVSAFRARNPGTAFTGLGGPAMEAAGVELAADQRDLAVGGLVELAGSLTRVASAWTKLGRALERTRPDLVVLIDSGGFNLPFARRVRRTVDVPILYYVAPQVWAWRTGRVRKLARRVDRLAVIFPFEPSFYAETSLTVDFVGHPLVEPLRKMCGELGSASARAMHGAPEKGPVIALLPGSRRNEIASQLSRQLLAAREIHRREPSAFFLLALAPSLAESDVRQRCSAVLPEGFPLRIVAGHAREVIRAADVVLAKPGTVTLEAALLERPLVVMGRANPLTAWVLRRAVKVPWLAMPNLIAGEAIVPELLQQDAVPERIADEVLGLLAGPAREQQLSRFEDVRRALGDGGAVDRTCEIAEEMLATAGA
jgi:lipid-A-disaccharide synthase